MRVVEIFAIAIIIFVVIFGLGMLFFADEIVGKAIQPAVLPILNSYMNRFIRKPQ